MGFKTKSRPPSVATTRSKKARRTISIIFRWKTPNEPPEPMPELPSNIPFRTESEPDRDRDPEIERELARARLEGIDPGFGLPTPTSASAPPSMRRETADSVYSESVSSYHSSWRGPSPLEIVPEDADSDGLPTYATAAFPADTVAYNFVRCSPFAMVIMSDTVPEQPLYHISIGVNVWMPTSFTTCIRRGGTEEGRVVAQLEYADDSPRV